jgi:hypothetical protein
VAICFFGQVKNISNREVDAFIENILRPLAEVYLEIDVYLHTYNMRKFTNPRNNEDGAFIDVSKSIQLLMSEISSLSSSAAIICIRQEQIEISHLQDADMSFQDLRYYLNRGDPWNNQGVSMLYFLRQLYSLDRVTRLWEKVEEEAEKGQHYDAVIYTRPDLLFFDRLPSLAPSWLFDGECKGDGTDGFYSDTTLLATLEENTIYTAGFDQYQGLNDRFAMGSPSVMKIYGHRLHLIDHYFATYPNMKLWAEPFLSKVMNDMSGVHNMLLHNFTFSRVRADGSYSAT